MKRSPMLVTAWCVIAGATACATTTPQSTADGPSPTPANEPTPAAAVGSAGSARRHYTVADVAFMQGMIAHHAQALAMTDLVPTRAGRANIRLLAERIAVSQQDEIARMQRWLEARGERAPSAHHAHAGAMNAAGAAGADTLMPGMLTAEELERLSRATGAEFDRLFLHYMIRHHEGALTMVARLFGTPGAAQEPEIFSLASDVDADQRAEIRRMQSLLSSLPGGVR